MKRTLALALALACVVLVGIFWLACAILRDHRLYTNFEKIQNGMSEREVIRLMGKPTRVENCGKIWAPVPKSELQGCVEELFYASPFAPALTQYYVIRLGAGQRVVEVAPYSSP
jgi:hypothetical protein